MIRRVKSEVESSLLPKLEYVLKPPLTPLQRDWYRMVFGAAGEAAGLLTAQQLMAKMLQLQKVVNHPKTIALSIDRDRRAAAARHAAAAGSEFIKVPPLDSSHLPPEAREREATLRALNGPSLIASSGKLALLDRLLVRAVAAGSRVLIFSQFTLTLDVLEQYVSERWGGLGEAYFRLDGTTNRIAREMDMRSFNAPNSQAFLYLISTRAGGQGINLATADIVVLYDTCYNPQVDLQAQDRAHRIGQKKQVRIYRLIAESSFEERVLMRARQKLILDALVIKKAGEASMLADSSVGGDGDVDGEMGVLSAAELWSMLSHGAATAFDPTADSRPPPTAATYDALLEGAQPTSLQTEIDIYIYTYTYTHIYTCIST